MPNSKKILNTNFDKKLKHTYLYNIPKNFNTKLTTIIDPIVTHQGNSKFDKDKAHLATVQITPQGSF